MYNDLQNEQFRVLMFEEAGEGKVKVVARARAGANQKDVILKQHFKLKYKGKKAANSFWLNYGRAAALVGGTLFFVTEKNQVLIYDLLKFEALDFDLSKTSTVSQVIHLGQPIQDIAVLSEKELFVLTEDHKIVQLRDLKGKIGIENQVLCSKDTISSCVQTTICCDTRDVIVCGFREVEYSNCYYLFDEKLGLHDVLEVVMTIKRSPQELHIHKAVLFLRENILHLLAMNIACSINLIVVHGRKLHPVIVNAKVCEGRHA